MNRLLMQNLISWKSSLNRKPLILMGARQVGKTWLMKEFGRTQFRKTAYINFDRNERMKSLFEGSIEPVRLLQALRIETGIDIQSEDTLLIFDEVQEVPRALSSLKYFCEDAPEYAIIAAGSQMGIALHEGTSFPVGKVSYLNLYPLNFREFLDACGDGRFAELLTGDDTDMINSFREKYCDRLREYFFVGGMPEAVQSYISDGDLAKVRTIQNELNTFYEQDFSKHAPRELVTRLSMVWQSIPSQLAKENRKFVYGLLRTGARAKEFETAIQWLSDCSLIHKVTRITKPDIPLSFYEDHECFKIYLNDVGLLCAMGEIDPKVIINGSAIFEEFKGALTEQYVNQQLISDCSLKPFYYTEPKSSGEIDFVVQNKEHVIPVEVKATENLKAKSLKYYHQKYQNEISVRTSLSNYRKDDWLTNIPLWAVCRVAQV